jgi:hypothetical protein
MNNLQRHVLFESTERRFLPFPQREKPPALHDFEPVQHPDHHLLKLQDQAVEQHLRIPAPPQREKKPLPKLSLILRKEPAAAGEPADLACLLWDEERVPPQDAPATGAHGKAPAHSAATAATTRLEAPSRPTMSPTPRPGAAVAKVKAPARPLVLPATKNLLLFTGIAPATTGAEAPTGGGGPAPSTCATSLHSPNPIRTFASLRGRTTAVSRRRQRDGAVGGRSGRPVGDVLAGG